MSEYSKEERLARIQATEFLAKELKKIDPRLDTRPVRGLVSQPDDLFKIPLTRKGDRRSAGLEEALKAFVEADSLNDNDPTKAEKLEYVKKYVLNVTGPERSLMNSLTWGPRIEIHHGEPTSGTYALTGEMPLDEADDFILNMNKEGYLTVDEIMWLRDSGMISFNDEELKKPQRQAFPTGAVIGDNFPAISKKGHRLIGHQHILSGNPNSTDGMADVYATVNDQIRQINEEDALRLQKGEKLTGKAGAGMREALAIPLMAKQQEQTKALTDSLLEKEIRRRAVEAYNQNLLPNSNPINENDLLTGNNQIDINRRLSTLQRQGKFDMKQIIDKVYEDLERKLMSERDETVVSRGKAEINRLMNTHRPGTEHMMRPLFEKIPGLQQIVQKRLM